MKAGHVRHRPFPRAITMAFQPIVDIAAKKIFAHEALVRGQDGAPAHDILASVNAGNQYAFDRLCRATALEWGSRLTLPGLLSINFLPNAVHDPHECMQATAAAAQQAGWPLTRLMFEVNEQEAVAEPERLLVILQAYRAHGILVAIDDFGAAYSGLNLLADFQPDLLKLDLALARGVSLDRPRQAIIRHTVGMCEELGVQVVAEGIEKPDDCRALYDLGISLQQGYLFSRPVIEGAPKVRFA
ncbi:EAL domain-containing protein [Dyella jejuensis]|uniref:EAL domain-containing protein n=1 Tax=Dyella jejuensis TaxID=1432009 RepID=A0ABW8JKF8_9GAMM